MTKRAGKPHPQLDESHLLVLGYQGTLRPRDQPCQAVPGQQLSQHPPPALEEFLAPWIMQAVSDLARRTAPSLLAFQGQPIPLEGMLLILKDRLLGLLIQAFDQQNSQQSTNFRIDHLPVLSHLLNRTAAEWASATAVFLKRFSDDHQNLAKAHGLDRLPAVQSVSGCGSDVHAGGHVALRVTFASAGLTLYYKPRAVTGEWLWHGLLQRIARHEPELSLPVARVHAFQGRLHYGWMDSLVTGEQTVPGSQLHQQHAATVAEADYWHRAGAILCLAQHVCLTDLHLANILATPSGPAVLDAECLATPACAPTQPHPARGQTSLFSEEIDAIQATGLIPVESVPGQPNISGLFGREGPVEGIQLPQWTVSDQRLYRLQPCSASLANHHAAPYATSPAAVLPKLLAGYRHAAEVLLSARGDLLRTDSRWRYILEQTHATRIVLRDTLTYACWISRSLQPAYLRSHDTRHAVVRATIIAASGQPLPGARLRVETRAVRETQVPRLVLSPQSRTLASSAGRPIVHGFAIQTGAQAVQQQLERLSRNHIEDVLVPALLAACLPS